MNRTRHFIKHPFRALHYWLYGSGKGTTRPLVDQVEQASHDLEQRVQVLKSLTARMRRERATEDVYRLAHGPGTH